MNRRDFLVRSAAGAIGAALLPADAMGDPAPVGPEPEPETYRVGEHVVRVRHPSGRLETLSWFGSLDGILEPTGGMTIVHHHVKPMSIDQFLDSCEDGGDGD